MNWLTLLIISVLSYSIGVLLQRVLLKEESSDPVAFSIVSSLVAGIVISIYAVIRGLNFSGFLDIIPNLLLMSALYAFVFYSMFESLKHVEASEFSILFATRGLWSIVIAIFVLHESFSMQQILGTVLIIGSVLIVSLKPQTSKKFKFGKGQLLVLASACVFGSAFINDAIALQKVDAVMYTPLTFIVPNIILWILFPKSTKKIVTLVKNHSLGKLTLLGICFGISSVTFYMAYQVGRNAAQIASINQTSIIVIVVLAIIFLKERSEMAKKILAAIVSFLGVLFVK